jgi:RNA-directed DNA polymerase
MNSLQFKKSQLKHLCAILRCSPGELEYIVNHIDSFYDEWFEKKKNKTTGAFKTYKDGTIKERAIRPSLNQLKVIQSTIKDDILAPIALPDTVHGGVKGRNNVTNAKPHQGKKYKFTTDLQDFYPNISHQQVYQTFLSLGFSDHKAYWLTKLTTWKFQLPQGTPTSTHISNHVFLQTDLKLIEVCKMHGITYTRYVDDLTFSSPTDFRFLLNPILNIVKAGGFKISYRKTQYKGDQTITGIDVFNNFIDAPSKIKVKAAQEACSTDTMKPYTNYLGLIRRSNSNMAEPR